MSHDDEFATKRSNRCFKSQQNEMQNLYNPQPHIQALIDALNPHIQAHHHLKCKIFITRNIIFFFTVCPSPPKLSSYSSSTKPFLLDFEHDDNDCFSCHFPVCLSTTLCIPTCFSCHIRFLTCLDSLLNMILSQTFTLEHYDIFF